MPSTVAETGSVNRSMVAHQTSVTRISDSTGATGFVVAALTLRPCPLYEVKGRLGDFHCRRRQRPQVEGGVCHATAEEPGSGAVRGRVHPVEKKKKKKVDN